MYTIITRRQQGILIEATLLPAMCSMIRSQFPTNDPPVEQHFSYPDNPHGTENAMRHSGFPCCSNARGGPSSDVSCRIDHWRNPDQAEYVLGSDMQPPPILVDVGDCHLLDESIPF
jgi:hypothetical protein